jgi:hypothetical protein
MSEQSDPDALMDAIAAMVHDNLYGENKERFAKAVESIDIDYMLDSLRAFNERNRQDDDERAE